MINWYGDWRPFDAPEGEEHFLRELRRETGDDNPGHPLHGKTFRILGWREQGHKHLFLHVLPDDRYAFVHLTWSRETRPQWPSCRWFRDEAEANAFLWHWGRREVRVRIGAALDLFSSEESQREWSGRAGSYDVLAQWVRSWDAKFYRPDDAGFRSFFSTHELHALAAFNATFLVRRAQLPDGPSAAWSGTTPWREIGTAAAAALACLLASPDDDDDDAEE